MLCAPVVSLADGGGEGEPPWVEGESLPAPRRVAHTPPDAQTTGEGASHYGFFAYVCFGMHLSMMRDAPNQPTRAFLQSLGGYCGTVGFQRAGPAGTFVTASALAQWLEATRPTLRVPFLYEVGHALDRREQCVRDRHNLVFGTIEQKELVLGRLALTPPVARSAPQLHAIFGAGAAVTYVIDTLRQLNRVSSRSGPSDEPLCAFAALADIDICDPVSASAAATTALFTQDTGAPFHAAQLDSILRALLKRDMPDATASLYSWHSARIFLATALLAAGVPHATIQAMCRWQTPQSLLIYARMGRVEYGNLVNQALGAQVSAARANNLQAAMPFLCWEDVQRATAARVHAAAATAVPVADADISLHFATIDIDADPGDIDADEEVDGLQP